MTRRGSILLEVLLAIAVFAFAGVVVLGVLQETVAAAGRADRRAIAMDLARSRLAEIDAGASRDDGLASDVGARGDASADGAAMGGGSALPSAFAGLRLEERLEPTEHVELDLAVIEVWDDAVPEPTALAQAMGSGAAEPTRLAVLRQLVRAGGANGLKRAEPTVPRPEFSK